MARGESRKSADQSAVRSSVSAGSRSDSARSLQLPAARRSVRLDRIIVGNRLRPADPVDVANMAVSFQENGQITPILLRPVRMEGDDVWYGLVAGLNRLETAQLMGWERIDATIRDLTDAQARLIEVDENLIRKGLTAYERAVFVAARLEAWAACNPDRVVRAEAGQMRVKRGRPGNSDKMSEFLGDTPATMGFAEATAGDLNINEKTVRRALAIARGLSPAAHAMISGSALGKKDALLRQIASVAEPAEQLGIVKALSEGRAKTFADAQAVAAGRTPLKAPSRSASDVEKAISKLWNGSSQSERQTILHWLSGRKLLGWTLTAEGDARG